MRRTGIEGGVTGCELVPGLRTACHSSSLFFTGYDILCDEELLNREPRKGIVGMERRARALLEPSSGTR